VFIKDPLENSMASFNFTSAVLDEGMTFTFSSWVCIANEVVASTATSLKLGSLWHLLQHPATTLMTSLKISAEFDFPI
jgi:hypothetical protein